MKTILVTGATGTVGSAVVKLLQGQADVHLRAGVRSPEKAIAGAETVRFSYDDAGSMEAACAGADAVFWVVPVTPPVTSDEVELARRFLKSAKAARTRHLVKLSVTGMQDPRPMIISQWHAEMEQAMRASGIGWTSLRPTGFMQNFLSSSAPRPDEGMYAPLGDAAVSYIDVRDIAAVAVKALAEPGHQGKVYDLTGPEALTMTKIAAILSEVTGRDIRYVNIPEEAARQSMLGAGLPQWMVEMILDIQAHARDGQSAEVTNTVQEVTGHAATPFLQFARDHAGWWAA